MTSRFHLYGGNVHGVFDELIPEKKIVLRWRLKSWPSGHYSNVEIDLTEMVSYSKNAIGLGKHVFPCNV